MSTRLWTCVWPPELAVYQSNPKAIPLASGPYENLCQNCGGYGIIMVYVIDGGPYKQPNGKVKWLDFPETPDQSGWYSGRLETAPCPVCRGGQMDTWLRQNCGLSGNDLEISLSTFSTRGEYSAKKPALELARTLLAMNHEPSGFITFFGGYGVGKSHLLKGLVNGFRQIRVLARYSTMADLLADIRERFGDDTGIRAVEDAIDDLRRARVLCLDEIDRVNMTGWAKETMFRLLNARYEERDRLLTVMATNLAPDEMPAEIGYLKSRFTAGVICEVAGPDVRPALGAITRRKMEAIV